MSVTPIPNAGQQKRGNEEIRKDFKFFRDNYDALLAQYPDQWIAVRWQRVVGAAPNYFEMESQLKEQGIAHNETICEFMAEDRNYLIASNWDLADA